MPATAATASSASSCASSPAGVSLSRLLTRSPRSAHSTSAAASRPTTSNPHEAAARAVTTMHRAASGTDQCAAVAAPSNERAAMCAISTAWASTSSAATIPSAASTASARREPRVRRSSRGSIRRGLTVVGTGMAARYRPPDALISPRSDEAGRNGSVSRKAATIPHCHVPIAQPRPQRFPPPAGDNDHDSRPALAQPRDRASRPGGDPSRLRAEPFTQAEWESNP